LIKIQFYRKEEELTLESNPNVAQDNHPPNWFNKFISFNGKGRSQELWEEWTIKIIVHQVESKDQFEKFKRLGEKQLRGALFYISTTCSSRLDQFVQLEGLNSNQDHLFKVIL
jgi:hypothetical protein